MIQSFIYYLGEYQRDISCELYKSDFSTEMLLNFDGFSVEDQVQSSTFMQDHSGKYNVRRVF